MDKALDWAFNCMCIRPKPIQDFQFGTQLPRFRMLCDPNNYCQVLPWMFWQCTCSISCSMLVFLVQLARFIKLMQCCCHRKANTNERPEVEVSPMTFRSTVWEYYGFPCTMISVKLTLFSWNGLCLWKHFKNVIYNSITQMCRLAEWDKNRLEDKSVSPQRSGSLYSQIWTISNNN